MVSGDLAHLGKPSWTLRGFSPSITASRSPLLFQLESDTSESSEPHTGGYQGAFPVSSFRRRLLCFAPDQDDVCMVFRRYRAFREENRRFCLNSIDDAVTDM